MCESSNTKDNKKNNRSESEKSSLSSLPPSYGEIIRLDQAQDRLAVISLEEGLPSYDQACVMDCNDTEYI